MLPEDLRKEMAAEILDTFGVEATYVYSNDSEKAISVRLQHDVEVIDDSGVSVAEHVISISLADIPSPKRGEKVRIGTQTFTLGRLMQRSAGLNRYEAS